jgi:hypothetical protein
MYVCYRDVNVYRKDAPFDHTVSFRLLEGDQASSREAEFVYISCTVSLVKSKPFEPLGLANLHTLSADVFAMDYHLFLDVGSNQ